MFTDISAGDYEVVLHYTDTGPYSADPHWYSASDNPCDEYKRINVSVKDGERVEVSGTYSQWTGDILINVENVPIVLFGYIGTWSFSASCEGDKDFGGYGFGVSGIRRLPPGAYTLTFFSASGCNESGTYCSLLNPEPPSYTVSLGMGQTVTVSPNFCTRARV